MLTLSHQTNPKFLTTVVAIATTVNRQQHTSTLSLPSSAMTCTIWTSQWTLSKLQNLCFMIQFHAVHDLYSPSTVTYMHTFMLFMQNCLFLSTPRNSKCSNNFKAFHDKHNIVRTWQSKRHTCFADMIFNNWSNMNWMSEHTSGVVHHSDWFMTLKSTLADWRFKPLHLWAYTSTLVRPSTSVWANVSQIVAE